MMGRRAVWLAAALMAAGLGAAGTANVRAGADPEKPEKKDIRKHVRVFHSGGGGAFLGVGLEDVKKDDLSRLRLSDERGAVVTRVDEDSPAAKAGIQEGDVILRFQGETVHSAAQLARLVREMPAGRMVSLDVQRDGAPQKLSVSLGERQASAVEFRDGGFGFFRPHDMAELKDMPEMKAFELELPKLTKELSDKRVKRLFAEDFPWGVAARGRLGIQYHELSDQLATYFQVPEGKGVLVSEVEADSPAAKAGVKAGDIILKVDGKAIEDGGDLRERLADVEAGQAVSLTVQRNGRQQELQATLGEGGAKVKKVQRRVRTTT